MDETTTEYALEVTGVGWVKARTVGADNPGVVADADEIMGAAARLAADYRRLGQPEMASKIRVLARQVTTVRTDWEPIVVHAPVARHGVTLDALHQGIR